MDKIIGVTDLQRRFRKTFDEVAEERVPYVLTRGSRPEAVLIPYERYLKFLRAEEEGVLRRFDEFLSRLEAAGQRFAEDEIADDVAEAVKAARKIKKR